MKTRIFLLAVACAAMAFTSCFGSKLVRETEQSHVAGEIAVSKKKSAENTTGTTEAIKKTQQTFAQQKDSFTDPRDKKTYKTVKIGEQTWMAENLNYNAEGKCYDNKPENCAKYGRLYNSAMAEKVCPKGWHIPTDKEWDALVAFAGGTKKLKVTSGWNESSNGTNDYGFSALPGGSFTPFDENGNLSGSGQFYGVGGNGGWWVLSTLDEGRHFIISIHGNSENVTYEDEGLMMAGSYSIRCVQGEAQSSAVSEVSEE